MTKPPDQATSHPPGKLLRRLRHLAGQAIMGQALIADGDNIVVGVSGGKDSLVLIKFLSDLRWRAPVKFGLGAVHLATDSALTRNSAAYAEATTVMIEWLHGLGLDFVHVEEAPPTPGLADYQPGGPSPCFGCSRARRNRLFELCRAFKANRLALGHHLDDAIETLLMNIFFSGRVEGILARQELFSGRLSLIRPLFLVPEKLVVDLAGAWALPVLPKSCPADGLTNRQTIKNLVAEMSGRNANVYGNLTAAVVAGLSSDFPESFEGAADDD